MRWNWFPRDRRIVMTPPYDRLVAGGGAQKRQKIMKGLMLELTEGEEGGERRYKDSGEGLSSSSALLYQMRQ
jgi:hypothetical protein